jgi:hypothetical protein
VGIAAYILFLVAGVGFGYAASGRWRWLPLVFPLALAIGAMAKNGVDATVLLRLIAALVITAVGVVLGELLDRRTGRPDQARYA